MRTIKEHEMLQFGDSVVIGVSGGKDSVALLDLLCSVREEFGLHLIAVHVNHGIRGESARRDEAFVKALCEEKQVDFRLFEYDVPALAKAWKLGEEECGRRLRYEAFESIGAQKIATAHTLSDSVETALFNLARGSGVKGLCGIEPKRGNIIRPLIACLSDEVRSYLKQKKLCFVTDETNADERYSRNLIRNKVLPLLEQVNPAFEEHCAQSMSVLRAQSRFLRALAKEHLQEHGANAEKIAALPEALRREVIRSLAFEQAGVVPEFRHTGRIEALLQTGSQVQFNGACFARVRAGNLEFFKKEKETAYCFELLPGEYALPVGILSAQVLNCEQFNNLKPQVFSFALDYDTISTPLICRNRKAGDRFFDGKRRLHKSVKDYLSEIAFAPEKRWAFPVFECAQEVIGTLGSHPAAHLAPGCESKRVLYICLRRE